MYIYKTTNLINGKTYVGQCINSVNKTRSYLGSGTALKSAFKKYGKENFKKEILIENVRTLNLLNSWEIHFIKVLKPNYNISPGGRTLTEETKRKISKANRGKKVSEETRRKMSEAKKGVKKSEEHKRNISKTQTGVYKDVTYEERYGTERAKEIKKKLSNSNRGKTYEEIHGIERAKEIKTKMSKSRRGRIPWNKGKTNDESKR
jgi:group I intron endonuclease